MRAFTSGKAINLSVAPVDDFGNAVVASSARYRLFDQTGLLTDWSAVAIVGGTISLTISAEINTIKSDSKIEARLIEFEYETETGTVLGSLDYTVEAENLLEVGVNSFVGYMEAIVHAADLDGLAAWNEAPKRQRISALRRSAVAISRLAFQLRQNNLLLDSERTSVTNRIYDNPTSIFTIESLDKTEIASLPSKFKLALARAQVLEANEMLAGSHEEIEMRQVGVLSQSVGESKTFFRTIKPLVSPLGKRAMQELMPFLYIGNRIGRA